MDNLIVHGSDQHFIHCLIYFSRVLNKNYTNSGFDYALHTSGVNTIQTDIKAMFTQKYSEKVDLAKLLNNY